MTLSPQMKDRLQKFRRNRRAYFSLIILVILFLASLPAELIFNDRPIIMKVDGTWYAPVFADYSYRDFGEDKDLPIEDYRAFLSVRQMDVERTVWEMYGDGTEPEDLTPFLQRVDRGEPPYVYAGESKVETREPADVWALWPLIPYTYKTENRHCTTERGNLINPFAYVSKGTGKEVPGAIQDKHYLGTDKQGRDVLARLIYGFRISLLFGLGLALTGTIIGCILGGVQGYFGGWTDLMGQRATEIWGSMPRLFLLMILSSFLASTATQMTDMQHFMLLFFILNLTAWMGMASQMRAMFLRARNLDYVKAARALGQSNFKIMLVHILPNSLVPIVTFVPFSITAGITALVSLDFLGFGVKYPAPSLGDLLAQGQDNMKAWWIILPTFLIFSVTLILLTFIGEGVRNAFDPRKKG